MATLEDLCPPCKIILNQEGAAAKLQQFRDGLDFLEEKGLKLTADAEKKAIEIICDFDAQMDEVLKLLETSVEQVGK